MHALAKLPLWGLGKVKLTDPPIPEQRPLLCLDSLNL